MKCGSIHLQCDVSLRLDKDPAWDCEYATYITLHYAYVLESPACAVRWTGDIVFLMGMASTRLGKKCNQYVYSTANPDLAVRRESPMRREERGFTNRLAQQSELGKSMFILS